MTAARPNAPDRVVVLTTDFRPQLGGVADYLHRIADALSRRVPVTVMSSVRQGSPSWERGYRFEQLAPLPDRALGHRFGDTVAPLRKLHTGAFFLALRAYGREAIARIGLRSGEDVAILIGIWDTASHWWCVAVREAARPYGLFSYGAELVQPLYGRLPDLRRDDFQQASVIVSCSAATARLAADRFALPVPATVVNPAIGPRPTGDELVAQTAALRRRLQISDGMVLLSVGRLVARKGFDLVLRSLAELPELPNLSYALVGDGPERSHLEALANDLGLSDRVHFLGAVDDLTKWAAYDACDVFVMPNRALGGADFEGFGIVFLEAALSGKPTIGGRSGGASDAIDAGVTGLLVDPEDRNSLSEALRLLANDAPRREQYGRAGAARARTVFNGDESASRLWELLGGR